MDFTAFSHGQIKSKIWLCEHLENHIPQNSNIKILGSWYNILAFMLLVRKPNYYNLIEGFDIDQNSLDIADKICDKWITEGSGVKNNLIDSSKVEYKKNDIVINCSPEHMENSEWFHKIPLGTTVCIQTSNMKDKASPWFIKTVHSSIEEVIAKYPLTNIFYQGELDINYGSWGYKRYMIIGIK